MLVKCPFYKSGLQWILRLTLLAFGTVGLYFLNIWVAVAYLIYYVAFFFLLMPLFHCKYCYYRIKKTTKEGKKDLLPKEKWKESYLKKHVKCGKKWGFTFIILWILPIVLIVISFFLNFSIIALICLIGFIATLALSLIHMRWKVCLTCAIMEECHSSF